MSWDTAPQPVAAPAPPPAAPPRRTPTWVVVLVTAAVMLGFGLSFVGGLVVGSLGGGGTASGGVPQGGAAPAPGAAPSAPAGGTPAAPGGSGTLDQCLVGTWRTTEHTEDWTTDQGAAELTGLVRTMVFTADGTQTITYDGATATATTQGQGVDVRFDGTVVYRTSTSDGTMSFQLVSVDGGVVVDPEGQDKAEELKPGTGPVRYTCDATTLRQEAEGYLSVYERVG